MQHLTHVSHDLFQGIRNAIRSRSRTTRRSGDSIELQALAGAERAATDGKVLRRMPRVESDDSQPHHHDVSILPISFPFDNHKRVYNST